MAKILANGWVMVSRVVYESLLLFLCFFVYACNGSEPGILEPPAVQFSDVTQQAGIFFRHETGAFGKKWMPETMGSGCALFDYDGDGYLDVLLINGTYWPGHEKAGVMPSARLYRNLGQWRFEDVTVQAGLHFSLYGMGCAVADYDGDGDLDIYITAVGDNRLLQNNDGKFVDVTDRAGVAGEQWKSAAGKWSGEWSTGAAWADVDGDGWLDLYVCNYVKWSPETDLFTTMDGVNKSYATPQQYDGCSGRLYHNRGDGTFEDVTHQSGIFKANGKALGIVVVDPEGDGFPDFLVANDTEPNFYFRNQGNGQFDEVGVDIGVAYGDDGRARAGMGIDERMVQGVSTVAVGNFSQEPISLFRLSSDGIYTDEGARWQIAGPTFWALTFGLLFVDYDLNGELDLVLANGHIDPGINRVQKQTTYAQQAQLFWNDGQGHFREVSNQSGTPFLRPVVGRGLSAGDLDHDGDLDLVMTTSGGSAVVMQNQGPVGQAIRVELRQKDPNRFALGAWVMVEVGDKQERALVRTGSSYLSQSETTLTFGLGKQTKADRVRVRWPDGTVEEIDDVMAGTTYRIEKNKGIVSRRLFGSN